MNKALLISIRPQHAVNILNGKKTLELRSWIPKGYKGWVYVYVRKGKRLSVVHDDENGETYYYLNSNWGRSLNQDIPFRFWFDEYIKLEWVDMTLNHNPIDIIYNYHALVKNVYNNVEWILPKLFLTKQQVIDYGKERDLYAWHIKDLEVFDKPKELREFEVIKRTKTNLGDWYNQVKPLKKAPQRSQWVYVK